MDSIRAQLDELMGKDRNLPLSERNKYKEHYDDPDVCKYALVSVCPHELFPNTKSDLGVCPKRHDEYLKRMFLSDENRLHYEKKYINETLGLIENMISNIDAKVKKAQLKLESSYAGYVQPKEVLEKIELIDLEIKGLLSQVEKLGEAGKIEQVENLTNQIEILRNKKEELKLAGDQNLPNGIKPLRVCEVCSAMQTVNDTDKRTQTHLEGKLHTGYATLRKEAEILRARREELKNLSEMAKLQKISDKKPEDNPSRKRSSNTSHSHSRSRTRERSHHRSSKDRRRKHHDDVDDDNNKGKRKSRRNHSTSSSSSSEDRSRSRSYSRSHSKRRRSSSHSKRTITRRRRRSHSHSHRHRDRSRSRDNHDKKDRKYHMKSVSSAKSNTTQVLKVNS